MKPGSHAPLSLALLAALLLPVPTRGQQADSASLVRDERLSAKITLSAREQPISELLRSLPNNGQPRLETTRATAWDRVTVIAKERSLQEVLSGLSELFNFRWESDSATPIPMGYALVQSIRARQYDDKLYRDSLDRAAEPLLKLAGYTRTPAAEWAKKRQQLGDKEPDDPLLRSKSRSENIRFLSRPGSHAGLQLLTTLSPPQRQTLVEEEELFLPWDQMTERQCKLARAMMSDPEKFDNSDFFTGKLVEKNVSANLAWLEQFGLMLNVETSPLTGGVTSYAAGTGGYRGGYASMSARLFEKGLLPVRGRPYPPWPDAAPVVYSDLEKTPFPPQFKLDPTKKYLWSDIVEELSKHLPMLLLSDDYTGTRAPEIRLFNFPYTADRPVPDLAKMSLAEGLDALCKAYDRLWWREKDAFFFRSRTWFIERLYEVPPPVLSALNETLGQRDEISTTALNLLSRLAVKQLQGLAGAAAVAVPVRRDRPRLGEFLRARTAYRMLQFYRTLSAGQKRLALAPEGLPWRRMTLSQQRAYLRVGILRIGHKILNDPRPAFRVYGRGKSQAGKERGAVWSMLVWFRDWRPDYLFVSYQHKEKVAAFPK